MKLSVIGLGKLGVCTAACLAYKGFEVIGVDINDAFVTAVNNGKAPVIEPLLQETIAKAGGRLKATRDYEYALLNSDMTFLILPTPSQSDGHFSYQYLQDALQHLAESFKKRDNYHIFIITSTVSPGTTESYLIPLIEKVSGKALNKDFGVCYNPEFIALGTVIRDFLNPHYVLIGESDKKAGDKVQEIYNVLCESKPHIARMSIISAEIAKISQNVFVTMKISFANTLANICEQIPGANVDDITGALGANKWVSPYFLKGGPSYGGPCLPRDGRAFVAFARQYNINAELAKATDRVNEFEKNHLLELVLNCSKKIDSVSVLGLAYKTDTPVLEESAAIALIHKLLTKSLPVTVYDPLAMENTKALFGSKISYANSVKECVGSSQVCLITTPAKEYAQIDESFITHNPTTIIDCWRILDPTKLGKRVKYIAWGRNGTTK